MLENTDGAYLFYDPEHETNLKYLYKMMLEMDQYHVKRLNFDDLNEVVEKFAKNKWIYLDFAPHFYIMIMIN